MTEKPICPLLDEFLIRRAQLRRALPSFTALTDPVAIAAVAKIFDRVAELEEQAQAGRLLPWQEEELAIVRELIRSIRQSWRGRLQ